MSAPLSRRQREVLQHAADGLTYEQSAARLDVSYNTLLTYARRAKAVLGANSIAHAVALGYQRGELALPGSERAA